MLSELDKLAHREMSGAGTIKFISSDKKFTSKRTGDTYQKMRCGFFHEAAKCPMVIRCHFFVATKTYAIEVGELSHSKHLVYRESDNLKKRAGVPKAVKAIAFSSPGKINVRPSVLLKSVRHKEVAVTVKLAKSLVRHQARLRTKELALEPGQAETWGGLHSMCLRYKKSAIVNFNEHSTYLLGLQSCSESKKIIAVISTENLLLNAYRQRFWGQPVAFACDASYRVTREGNGIYPVVTISLGQKTKTIAYAIISNKKHQMQKFIFSSIKEEVEKIVRARTLLGFKHC